MTGACLSRNRQESLEATLTIDRVTEEEKLIDKTLLDIKDTYKVPTIEDVNRMYQVFKDNRTANFPLEKEQEKILHALDNTRTHYRVLAYNKNTPEPLHDPTHDEHWRE